MDDNTCVVDAPTLIDHIHLIKSWVYGHDVRLLVPACVFEQVEQLVQKSSESKLKPEEATRSRPGARSAKKDFPTFDANPKVTREFLERAHLPNITLPVEFQQESEFFSQWRSKEIMAEKEKFDDKNPASYAQTLLMKLNFSDGTVAGAPKAPSKPKLVARDSAPGQSPWKKNLPPVIDDGVTPSSKPYLSYALWQIYENGRWDSRQLPGKPVFLLSDNAEIQLFAKKAGLKCRGTAALQSDLHALVKKRVDANAWGELEQDFGSQQKPTTLTSAEKAPAPEQGSNSRAADNIRSITPPTNIPNEPQLENSSAFREVAERRLESSTEGNVHGLQQPSIEVQASSPAIEDQAGNAMVRPWSEVVRPRSSSERKSVEIDTDIKTTSHKGEPSCEAVAAEQVDVQKPVPEPAAPALDIPAPIPTKSPWKKLPPPMPEPVSVIPSARPPSRDIARAEKIEKQNSIANWVNNVQPPTQNVQLKRQSHHRKKSSESKSDVHNGMVTVEEARRQPSAIMKRPLTRSTSSSKEQIGALTPPLTPQASGTSPQSVPQQLRSPVRLSVGEVEAEDSDDEIVVFNPRAKRFSGGERGPSKIDSLGRPSSSGRLVRPEFPSPQTPARQLGSPTPAPDTYEPPIGEHSPRNNETRMPTEEIDEEITAPKNPPPPGPQSAKMSRNITQNGPPRPHQHGRARRIRQPVVPVVIDPDDFGRRSLVQQPVRGGGVPNGHRGAFQNGYGRGSSPRGSPHPTPRQMDAEVDFVLKSGSTRGSTRGRGKLWVP